MIPVLGLIAVLSVVAFADGVEGGVDDVGRALVAPRTASHTAARHGGMTSIHDMRTSWCGGSTRRGAASDGSCGGIGGGQDGFQVRCCGPKQALGGNGVRCGCPGL
jgi:hypothetical protein